MNKNMLLKCIEEMKKEQPNISYVQGILETLVEMDSSTITTPSMVPYVPQTFPMPQPYYVGDVPNTYVSTSGTVGSGLITQKTEEEINAELYERGTVGIVG